MANFYKEAKVDSVSQIKLLYIELRTWLQMVANRYIDINNVDTDELMRAAKLIAIEENNRMNKPTGGQYADVKQAKFDRFNRNSADPEVMSQLKRMLAGVMTGHPESFDTRKGSIFAIINGAKNASTAGLRTYGFTNEIKGDVAWFAPKAPIVQRAGSDASTTDLAKALTALQENNQNVVCKFRMNQTGQNEWLIDGGVNGLKILLGQRGREFTRIDENGNRVIDEKGGRVGVLQLCGITPMSMDLVNGKSTKYAIALSPAEGKKFAEAISDPDSKLREYVMLTNVLVAKESETQTSLQLDDSADTNSANNSIDEQLSRGHANMGNLIDNDEADHKEIVVKLVKSIEHVMSAVSDYVTAANTTTMLTKVPKPHVSLDNEDLLVQSVSALSSFFIEFARQGGKGIELPQRTCHYGGIDYPIVTVDEFKTGQLISKLQRINGLAFHRSLETVVVKTANTLGSFFTNIEPKLKKVFDSVEFSDKETDSVSTSEEVQARNALRDEYNKFMKTPVPNCEQYRLIDMISALDAAYESDISDEDHTEINQEFKHTSKRMTPLVRDLYEKYTKLDYALNQGSATNEEFKQIKRVIKSLAYVFAVYVNNHLRWQELSKTPVELNGQKNATTIGELIKEIYKGTDFDMDIDPYVLRKAVDAFDVITKQLNVYGIKMTDQSWDIIAKVAVPKKEKAKENENEAERPEVPPTEDAPDTPAESDESDDLFTIDDDDEPMIDMGGGSNETATPSESSDPADDMVLRDDDDDDDDDDDGLIGHLTR